MRPLLERMREALERQNIPLADKLAEWAESARTSGQTIDRIMVGSGHITESQMLKIMSETLDLPVADKLQNINVPQGFVSAVPVQFARTHNLIATAEENGSVRVACCYPLDVHPMDELSSMLDKTIMPMLAPRAEIAALINKAYQQKVDVIDEMLDGVDEDELAGLSKEVEQSQDLLDIANKAPIIKLVNMIIFQAVKMRASDIHIQPYEEKLQIRYRIDGIVYDMMIPPKKIQEAIISRVKIMGKMDIAERRLPQDGRATIRLGDSEVDIRIASVPTSHGERIVMRLLDKSARLYDMRELGLDDSDHLPIMKRFISCTHGIILVTGPTGSGKTTTLYAALKDVNSSEKNVITIEDPIEYHLQGVSQIEVSNKKGLTFATGLRSIVRQDPDIIMVGEIRDVETANIAIQSALTGHLVFSTLHTNDAPGAVTRLLDLGIEPYLVASSLIGVIAQRLVRLICPNCRESRPPNPESLDEIGLSVSDLPNGLLYRGKGCPHCFNTGYTDRTAIYEILPVDDIIRDQVINRASSTIVKQEAIKRGMRTLRMDGAKKVIKGQTTPDEVMRVTQMDTF